MSSMEWAQGSAAAMARSKWRVVIAFAALAIPLAALDPQKLASQYSQRVWHTADGLPQDSVRAIARLATGICGLARRLDWHDSTGSVLRSSTISAAPSNMTTSCRWPLPATAPSGSGWPIPAGFTDGPPQRGFVPVWKGPNVRALFDDRDGVVWVGTQGGGLLRVADARHASRVGGGMGLDDVRSIAQDKAGAIWIGTEGQGLFRYSGGALIPYRDNERLPDNRIWALWVATDGSVWAGTKARGLLRIAGDEWRHFTTRDGLASDAILALAGDRDGNLWIGTDGGGWNRYQAGRFTADRPRSGLNLGIVRAIFEDREGNVWLGTAGPV
jgi:hypothetical protein